MSAAPSAVRPGRPGARRRELLARRVQLLALATIAYNVVEAALALSEGTRVSSTALVGFGVDSAIEVAAAAALAWQFSGHDAARTAARERRALRVIALSFFGLAAFVSLDALRSLTGASGAGHSTAGLVLAATSVVVMPALAVAQRRAGRELGSGSAVAGSSQTMLCTYLSAVLLVGLALDRVLGWWWADPVAAVAIAAVALREGVRAWRGEACCPPLGVATAPTAPTAPTEPTEPTTDGCACCAPAPSAPLVREGGS